MKIKSFFISIFSIVIALATVACGENYIDEPVSNTEIDTDEISGGIEMDTISSYHKYEFKYSDDVVELNEEQISYLDDNYTILPGDLSIHIKAVTPEGTFPKEGAIIVIPQSGNKVPLPYMGRIDWIDGNTMHMSEVDLEQVYSYLDLDVRLNTEQLSELYGVEYYINDAGVNEISDNEFFDLAPACAQRNKLKLGEEDNQTPPLLVSSPFEENSVEDRKQGTITLRRVDDGYELSISQAFKHPEITDKYPVEINPEGKIILRPLYKKVKKIIRDNFNEVDIVDEGWEIDFGCALNFAIKSSKVLKPISIKTPTFAAIIPIPYTPLNIWLRDRIEIGIEGSINFGFGWNSKVQITTHKELRGDEVIKKEINSDFNWENGLKWKMKNLTMNGSIYYENIIGTHISGCPLALMTKQKATLSGSADILDDELWAKNPMLSFDITTKAYIYAMDPREWTNLGYSVGFAAPPISYDHFPVFPQCNNPLGLRAVASSNAELTYESDIFYLLAPLIKSPDINIVDDSWFIDRSDSNIFKSGKASFVSRKGFTSNYIMKLSGLDPAKNYYAIPSCKIFGKKYYSNPIPFSSAALRLGIIGPSNIRYDDNYASITFAYDNNGRVSRIYNTMSDIRAYFSYEPMTIKSIEYNYDDDGYYVPQYCSLFSNMKFDEESGVLTSFRWCEDGDYGNVKLYYDSDYHLTGLSGNATDGYSASSFDWDEDGRLLKFTNIDSEGYNTIFEYRYPLLKESDKNHHLQWTIFAGMPFDVLGMGRLVGRPTSYLPSGLKITEKYEDHIEVEDIPIKYKFNKDNSISSESYKVNNQWVEFPYGYRMVGMSDEELNRDKFFGTSRSGSALSQSTIFPIKSLNLFGSKKRKENFSRLFHLK